MWLRHNDMEIPNEGIAPRADQRDSSPYAWGQVDCKVAKEAGDKYWMIVGPTTSPSEGEADRFKPYKWEQYPQINHEGMAQEFNFEWQLLPLDAEMKNRSGLSLQTE